MINPLDRSIELHYRLRVLKAAQDVLLIPRGPTTETMLRLAQRTRVRAEDLHAKLVELEGVK